MTPIASEPDLRELTWRMDQLERRLELQHYVSADVYNVEKQMAMDLRTQLAVRLEEKNGEMAERISKVEEFNTWLFRMMIGVFVASLAQALFLLIHQ